jgi:hypothetical protein
MQARHCEERNSKATSSLRGAKQQSNIVIARSETAKQHRHCEERSDEAILSRAAQGRPQPTL